MYFKQNFQTIACPTAAVPSLFGTRNRFLGRQFFQGLGEGVGMVSGMIVAHYIQAHLLLCATVPNRPGWYWSAAQGLGTRVLQGLLMVV